MQPQIPPTMPDHAWHHSLMDGLTHQFPEPATPDAEDILTTLCGREVMAFRVAVEHSPPYCIECILATGRQAAAEQDAAWTRRVAGHAAGH